jgi:hypothetical protein
MHAKVSKDRALEIAAIYRIYEQKLERASAARRISPLSPMHTPIRMRLSRAPRIAPVR